MILASQLKRHGICVNVVCPGRASTAMTRSLSPSSQPGLMKLMHPVFLVFFRHDGGRSAAKTATRTSLEGVTGADFDPRCQRQELHPSAHEAEVQPQNVATLQSVDGEQEAS